jgi:hypothetical protein
MLGMGLTRTWLGLKCLQPHRRHQARHALAVDRVALTLQPGRHATHAVIGRLHLFLIQQAHQMQSLWALSLGGVIVGGP